MERPLIYTLLAAALMAWTGGAGLSPAAQASETKWGSSVPARLQCDAALLAFYDSLRKQMGVERLLLTVLDEVKEEGAFGKGTFHSIRSLARHRDFKAPRFTLLRQSVEFFLEARNHRDDLLVGTVSGRLEKPLCSASYFPCNEQRFAMGIVGDEAGSKEFDQKKLSGDEAPESRNAPLDLILFGPYIASQNRSDLVFNWQGSQYLFEESSFDAAVILHELTHYLDEKRVTRWVNANLELLKAGKPADELFVNGSTVSYSDDLTQVKDAADVTVDMGLLLIYYEGRGHQVSMQTQLLSLPPTAEKPANAPQRRRPSSPATRRIALPNAFLQDLSVPIRPTRRPADAAAVREFQRQMAWKSIKNSMTRRWRQNGVPGWAGPVTENNLFEVSDALAATMQTTIDRVQSP